MTVKQSRAPGSDWIASSQGLLAMTWNDRERSPPRQPVGKIPDGLAIDGRPVPLAHRLEIRTALAVRRASRPARGVQQIGGGGEHVRHAVAQVDMAVAVEIDAV